MFQPPEAHPASSSVSASGSGSSAFFRPSRQARRRSGRRRRPRAPSPWRPRRASCRAARDVARLHRHRAAVVEFEVAFALEADRIVEGLGAVHELRPPGANSTTRHTLPWPEPDTDCLPAKRSQLLGQCLSRDNGKHWSETSLSSTKSTAREVGEDPPDNEHTRCSDADKGGS